tara:strand:+ start:1806 stop:2204 length:399 start_codon:yes stop_codon:yes gene_type:complete
MNHALTHARQDITLVLEQNSTKKKDMEKTQKKKGKIFAFANDVNVVNFFLNFIEEWLGSYIQKPTDIRATIISSKNESEGDDILLEDVVEQSEGEDSMMAGGVAGKTQKSNRGSSAKLSAHECRTCMPFFSL